MRCPPSPLARLFQKLRNYSHDVLCTQWPVHKKSSGSGSSSSLTGSGSDLSSRFDCEQLNKLKDQIESCFASESKQFPQLKSHAADVRMLMSESVKALMVLTNTTDSVVGLIPDTRYACEEGDPELACSTLSSAKSWIGNFVQEARALKDRSDLVVKNIEALNQENGVGTLLSLLQTHRVFIVNLDVSAQVGGGHLLFILPGQTHM